MGNGQSYEMPDSARAVFRRLALRGRATRPVLSGELGLSRPTMSAAIGELERHGLVNVSGESRGHTGRSASVYSVDPSAGHVLAVELGASRVRVEATTLDFVRVASAEERLSSYRRVVTPSVVAKAAALLERVRAEVGQRCGQLRDIVVVAPTVPGDLGMVGRRPEGVDDLRPGLRLPDDVSYFVENNVNCAAMAEHRLGAARGYRNFLYLQVGVKIGAGFVLNDELHAGAHGAAGEIALIPYPWAPGAKPVRLGLEHYLGSDELVKRCQARWPDGAPPRSAAALFAAAVGGHAVAVEMVAEHARDIGQLAVNLMTVFDPELVVLGGGVGQNELILPGVRKTLSKLAWDTELRTGELGSRATIVGATHVAVDRSLTSMLGQGS